MADVQELKFGKKTTSRMWAKAWAMAMAFEETCELRGNEESVLRVLVPVEKGMKVASQGNVCRENRATS